MASPTAMIDLDRFKLVNDTLGHLAGDELIRAIYAILIEQSRSRKAAVVARLGGDEFGVLFDTSGPEQAAESWPAIVSSLACATSSFRILRPFGPGIGLLDRLSRSPKPMSNRDPIDIMRKSDLALNDAKQNRAAAWSAPIDESMDESRSASAAGSRVAWSEAIGRGELSMVYQPIVAREELKVVGFEALVRWNTEEFGPVSPALFIPIAEESNLIHELGDWILAQSLRVVADWPGQYVSINFSPRQFRRPNFVGHILECVQRAGVEPNRVQIEITETAIFDDADRAADTLYRLRQMGFRIALDDFGTGYSSLYNIRKFALDSLKIDRSFIDGMGRERESAAIVHSIIHLGRALGLGVIAEGVETEAQLQALRLAGASHLQGYLFSRPVAPEVAAEIAHCGFMVDPSPVEVAYDEQARNGTHG